MLDLGLGGGGGFVSMGGGSGMRFLAVEGEHEQLQELSSDLHEFFYSGYMPTHLEGKRDLLDIWNHMYIRSNFSLHGTYNYR